MSSKPSNLNEAIIGNRQLQVPLRDIPDYEPDIITLASLDDFSPELLELREYLRAFIKKNKPKWSISALARFLNTDPYTLAQILPVTELQGFNEHKAQTILVLKPRADLEHDELLYRINKL